MSYDDTDGDVAAEMTQRKIDEKIEEIRRKAVLAKGVEGDCDLCGEWTSRLVGGACCPCRDKYKLP